MVIEAGNAVSEAAPPAWRGQTIQGKWLGRGSFRMNPIRAQKQGMPVGLVMQILFPALAAIELGLLRSVHVSSLLVLSS